MPKLVNIDRFVACSSLLSFLVGVLGLAGCYLQLPILRTILPGMVAIAANTSACFVLLGISLWLLREGKRLAGRSWTKWMAKLAAASAGVVGLLSLAEYLGNLDFGIDQLLFTEPAPGVLGHVRPGLMSPLTALDLVLLGSALLLLDWVTRRRTWPAQVLCFIAGTVAVFTLVDLILARRQFQAHIALSTVTVLAIFPFAVICARPNRALGGLLVASGSKRALLRELFFPTSVGGGSLGAPLQYALAVILVVAATLLRHWLTGYLSPLIIFLTYYPAVMISALLGGMGPGILATLLAAICANYFFLTPVGAFTIASRGDLHGLLMFIGIGLTISWLASALEQTREDATAALRQSAAQLKEGQRIAHLGSWTLDVKTGAVTWSEELYRMFRLDPSVSAIPYQEQPKIFTPETWSRLSAAVDKTVQTGEPYELELETVLSDGSHGWMLARGEAQRDESGEVATLRGVALDITEQRQSQQKLRQQAALLDLAHDAIFVRDLDSRIVFWNHGAQALYGWSPEEATGKISHELLHSRFPQPLQTIEVALQKMPSWQGEITHTHRDGKVIVDASRWSLLRDEKGNPTAILEINRDITERKRAEATVRSSEVRYRRLFETAKDGILMIDADSERITDVNAFLQEMLGYSREEIVGKKLWEIGPLKDVEACRISFADLQEKEYLRYEDLPLETKDGRSLSVEFISNVYHVNGDRVIQCNIRDVTDRKRAEAALRASEQRYRTLFESAADAIFVMKDGVFVACNDLALRMFSCSREQIIGHTPFEFSPPLQPDGRNSREAALERIQQAGCTTEAVRFEWLHCRADKTSVPTEVSLKKFNAGEGSYQIAIVKDVSARKQAELALQESEDNFRTLVNFVPQMVWMCRRDGLNIYFNQRWFDYTGLTPAESYGRGWSTPFHPDHRQAAWDAWNQAVATGETYQIESRLRAADGSYRWFLMRGAPLRDESGEIVRWFGTCTDIDDMKRTEAELAKLNQELEEHVRRRTAELQAIFDTSPIGLAIADDAECRHIRGNPAIERLVGLATGAELSKTASIVPPYRVFMNGSELSSDKLPMQRAARGEVVSGEVMEIHRADGSMVTAYTSAAPLLDEQQRPRGAVGAFLDITALKRAEEALRDSEELLRAVTDNSPDAIFVKDSSSRWLMANPAVLRIVGKTAEQALGKTDLELYADTEVGRAILENDRHIMETGRTESFEEVADTPEGRRTFLSLKAPRRDAHGDIVGLIGISRDITARKLAEMDLQRRTAELEAANKELEAFTYSIAHDLRGPLRHVGGFSRILSEEFAGNLPAEAQGYLRRIEEGTRRMGTLVDDLLNLARIGRKELCSEVCGLRSMVDEVIAELKPEYEGRRVDWKVGPLPAAECDPGLMKQVFVNLLTNALKFTRPRQPAEIEIGQQEGGAIFVRDNGVGFSMKYADKLFGVFQRLHRTEDFEGTGVGLATVQRIIHKHGGQIWACAELDKGATFYFTLARGGVQAESATAGK